MRTHLCTHSVFPHFRVPRLLAKPSATSKSVPATPQPPAGTCARRAVRTRSPGRTVGLRRTGHTPPSLPVARWRGAGVPFVAPCGPRCSIFALSHGDFRVWAAPSAALSGVLGARSLLSALGENAREAPSGQVTGGRPSSGLTRQRAPAAGLPADPQRTMGAARPWDLTHSARTEQRALQAHHVPRQMLKEFLSKHFKLRDWI